MLSRRTRNTALAAALSAATLAAGTGAARADGGAGPIHYSDERRLANVRQLTFGGQNAEAYFSADGDDLIFQSTRGDRAYLVDVETRETERITHYPGFDGFPMFSYDGTKLVFASNRNGKVRGETNVFIADWR